MLTRIVSALIGLVLLFVVMFSERAVLSAAVLIVSSIALFEVYHAYQFHKIKLLWVLGVLVSVAFSFGDYLQKQTILLFSFCFLLLIVLFLLARHETFSSKDVGVYVLVTLVISFAFANIGYLRRMENGAFYIWLPFIVAWCSDSAAYFAGRFLGKHKLCEKISPKKTVEGAIGGVAGSVIGLFIYQAILWHGFQIPTNSWLLAVMGVFGSVCSQIGDLFASVLKRENEIKDFGNIMPGHGGILDRFDSLILTTPFVFLFVTVFPLIG